MDSICVASVVTNVIAFEERLGYYRPSCIFNIYEKGLFYMLLPRQGYICKHENLKPERGTTHLGPGTKSLAPYV